MDGVLAYRAAALNSSSHVGNNIISVKAANQISSLQRDRSFII